MNDKYEYDENEENYKSPADVKTMLSIIFGSLLFLTVVILVGM